MTGAAEAGPSQDAGRTAWRIVGATLITMDEELGVIERGEVGIQGGRIAYVRALPVGEGRPGSEGPSGGEGLPGARTIEAGGMTLLPGLVNAHTHLSMNLLRGFADDLPLLPWLRERIWPAESRLTPEDVYWGAAAAAAESLLAGVTCAADMYFHMDAVAAALSEFGMRGVLARGLVASGDAAEDAAKLREAVAFAERWEGKSEGRLRTRLAPHAPYTCPPSYLKEIAAAAATLGVGLHMHVSETAGEVEECLARHGRPPALLLEDLGLFDLPFLAAHGVHLRPEELPVLARHGVGVAHCPVSNLKLGCGFAPVAELLDQGVPVALGSDGAASANRLGLFESIRLAALLAKGRSGDPTRVPALAALRMATLGGAEALGLDGELGSISPGKAADLVLLGSGRPHLWPCHDAVSNAVYSASDADVDSVWVAGERVVAGGRLLRGHGLDRLRAEVEERARRIAGVEAGGGT